MYDVTHDIINVIFLVRLIAYIIPYYIYACTWEWKHTAKDL
jgi:hypothetical protein